MNTNERIVKINNKMMVSWKCLQGLQLKARQNKNVMCSELFNTQDVIDTF